MARTEEQIVACAREMGLEPANPAVSENYLEKITYYGLTKREAFAMAAVQGLSSILELGNEEIAEHAVSIADNLLVALLRNKT